MKCPWAFRLRRLAQNACHGGVHGHFSCKFPNKSALEKCPCAFRLRRLAQNRCRRGVPSHLFTKSGSCDMSICISTAQARAKCASRFCDGSSSSTPSSSTSSSTSYSTSTSSSPLIIIIIIIVVVVIIIIIIIKTNSKTWNRLMIERLSFLCLSTMNLSQIFERTPISSINLFSQQCIQN